MTTIAQDVWTHIDTFLDNLSLTVVHRLSTQTHQRTARLIAERQQQKHDHTQVYRAMVHMSLQFGTDTRMEDVPYAGNVEVRAEVNDYTTTPDGYDCVLTLYTANPPGATTINAIPVPDPDASDAYDNALARATDEHAVFLYDVLGPLREN